MSTAASATGINWVARVLEWHQARRLKTPLYEFTRRQVGWATCAFDPSHVMPPEALASHHARCSTRHDPTRQMAFCPFDSAHVVARAQYDAHVASCPSRPRVGDRVEARWSSDGQWYPARVDAVEGPDSISVFFTEYNHGGVCAPSDIRAAGPRVRPRVATSTPPSKPEGWALVDGRWHPCVLDALLANQRARVTLKLTNETLETAIQSVSLSSSAPSSDLDLQSAPPDAAPSNWHASIQFDGASFDGSGPTKMAAKQAASESLFSHLSTLSVPTVRAADFPDEFADLPPFTAPHDIVCTQDARTCTDWLAAHAHDGALLGFDTEWAIMRDGGHALAVIQLAAASSCLVFCLPPRGEIPDALVHVLESEDVRKVGINISQDARLLASDFNVVLAGISDVALTANDMRGYDTNLGTRRLAATVLGRNIAKKKGLAVSDWRAWPLSSEQVAYAAEDAAVARDLHLALVETSAYADS